MARYRKKPVVGTIEAAQWHTAVGLPMVQRVSLACNWSDCGRCGVSLGEHGWIPKGDSGFFVCPGGWVITDRNGEHYPHKGDDFETVYEPAGGGD